MSRMFKSVTRTWNVFTGCLFECQYCWARSQAQGRLKNAPRYKDGFTPSLNQSELAKTFRPGEFVFVAAMGDISFASRDDALRILDRTRHFPKTDFLLQSKNPLRFHDFQGELPDNVYLGTTLETNDYLFSYYRRVFWGVDSFRGSLESASKITKAPSPFSRYSAMADPVLQRFRKFVSIEPIMVFDLEEMVQWIQEIRPEIVEIGADNYGHNLPEPPWSKVEDLLTRLREICPEVKEKEGLERLRGR